MSILEHFVAIAPYFHELSLEDCHFTVADTEKFIVSLPGKHLKMSIVVGDPIREGALTAVAMKERKRIVRTGNRELYGIAHLAVCVPIFENNSIVGCISIGYSMEKSDRIHQLAFSLENMVQTISSSSQSIAASSQELAATHEEMLRLSTSIKEQMNEVASINKFVTDVAGQTNLLGLNAAIQAEHAGEYGRGFSVVAREIRRLATRTNDSAVQIRAQLEKVTETIEYFLNDSETANNYTQEQAAATEQLVVSVEEIRKMAQQLESIARIEGNILTK